MTLDCIDTHLVAALQVMQSLDHLVTDIEQARVFAEEASYSKDASEAIGAFTGSSLCETLSKQQWLPSKQHAVVCALADVTAELGARFDLHDTLC